MADRVSASNRLYMGGCASLLEALRCMIEQYHDEQRWIRCRYMAVDPVDGEKSIQQLGVSISVVEQCRDAYNAAIAQVEQSLFAQWEASDNEETQRIGEAARLGEYSSLAL